MRERERGGRSEGGRKGGEDFEIRGTVDVALLGDTQVTKAREKGEREATRSVGRVEGGEGEGQFKFQICGTLLHRVVVPSLSPLLTLTSEERV